MKTIIITGSSGFLGKNLIKYLINNNISKKIIAIDNFISSSKNIFLKFISENKYNNIVDIVEGDICDDNLIDTIKQLYNHIDEIYHMASIASPKYYMKYPLETLDVGYKGTKNILELCKHYNDKNKCKLLYTSTSEVYGDALEHPQKETYYGNVNSFGKRSCYDESKRIGESLVYSYIELYNLDLKIVRIFNTYGPHMDIHDGRIVTEIIKSFLLGSTLNIYGTGSQTRSLCYVDDTIKMIVKVMNSEFNEPINVGSEFEISINDLVKKCQEIFNKNINNNQNLSIIYTELEKDDPKVRKPCLIKHKNLIGDINYTTLDIGLTNTFIYFKQII